MLEARNDVQPPLEFLARKISNRFCTGRSWSLGTRWVLRGYPPFRDRGQSKVMVRSHDVRVKGSQLEKSIHTYTPDTKDLPECAGR